MTDGPALLAAILADPGNDTVRLVYADWLEENGQRERAEFIRVQVELAKWGGCDWKTKHVRAGYVDCNQWNKLVGEGRVMTWCPKCARHNDLRRRERELLDANFADWFSLFQEQPGTWSTGRLHMGDGLNVCGWSSAGYWYEPERGFVSHLTCSWPDWSRHAASILERHPVTKVTLTTPTDIEYFDSDMQLLYSEGWQHGPVLDQDELTREDGDSDERAFLRTLWPRIEFELPSPAPTP